MPLVSSRRLIPGSPATATDISHTPCHPELILRDRTPRPISIASEDSFNSLLFQMVCDLSPTPWELCTFVVLAFWFAAIRYDRFLVCLRFSDSGPYLRLHEIASVTM